MPVVEDLMHDLGHDRGSGVGRCGIMCLGHLGLSCLDARMRPEDPKQMGKSNYSNEEVYEKRTKSDAEEEYNYSSATQL